MSSDPPPMYAEDSSNKADEIQPSELQIMIVPIANHISFQGGYLGADSERAAIEGELQIKGGTNDSWGKVTITLQTVEAANGHEIELNSTETILWASAPSLHNGEAVSSVLPFSIPLPPDTPQCIHTPKSHLLHTLTARLYLADSEEVAHTKSVVVHTRRFTSHSHQLHTDPQTKTIDDPTRVEVEIPRTSFKAGEPIPLYVTVPPPNPELILDHGLRLRNIRAELVRVVAVKKDKAPDQSSGSTGESSHVGPSTSTQKQVAINSAHAFDLRQFIGTPDGGEVVANSGASCRVHPSRPLHIRLVLHQPAESESPTIPSEDPDVLELGRHELQTQCASISQATVLLTVSFMVCVHVTFMHMTSHTERTSTITIPVVVLPRSAPLPEVEESLDTAYRKKHDRPPAKTVRHDDADAPQYEDGAAGPSFTTGQGGAPPPFEEREAPPPFSTSSSAVPEASSSRLPTFLESEAEIYVPSQEEASIDGMQDFVPDLFEGEGIYFGFTPSQHFDGYHDDPAPERSATPPPTLEMATRDPNVTQLATLSESAARNALEMVLEQHPDIDAMDDPSDLPPSIDSDFRVPHPREPSPPAFTHSANPEQPQSGGNPPLDNAPGHAPPPYNVPDNTGQAHAAHPPPYAG